MRAFARICGVMGVIVVASMAVGTEIPRHPIMGREAPVNPYNGLQAPEEVYEFTESPRVEKTAAVWVITFASKANCDATVSILDKDGDVIRHLASGVLGKNAPHPFQQNSLSQRIEWDGLKDDFTKADPEGCTVRVSLGLKPEFEMNLMSDMNELYGYSWDDKKGILNVMEGGTLMHVARAEDGTIYVVDGDTGAPHGRAYDKEGKYLYTFFPPAAKDMEKLMSAQGYEFATTIWGDKVIKTPDQRTGAFTGCQKPEHKPKPEVAFADALAALKLQPGVKEIEITTRPPEIAESTLPRYKHKTMVSVQFLLVINKYIRLAVDRTTDDLYFGGIYRACGGTAARLDGVTGKFDEAWFPKGNGLAGITDMSVGPDGLLYLRLGEFGSGYFIGRLDKTGTPVPFTGNTVMKIEQKSKNWPDDKERLGSQAGERAYGGVILKGVFKKLGQAAWIGETHHSNTHTRGLYAASNGLIIAPLLNQGPAFSSPFLERLGVPSAKAVDVLRKDKNVKIWDKRVYVALLDNDGNYLWANLVGDTCNGHNAFMDRDGNIYSGVGGSFPKDGKPDGIADGTFLDWAAAGHASVVKFHWKGEIPITTWDYTKEDAKNLKTRPGSLWAYHSITGYASGCTCFNCRSDMDYWSRMWLTTNHLNSIVVLDANGNRMARVGRYGNVDDADPECGKIHFTWVRAITVSDKAVYVGDMQNRRILKAALKYAAEESVPLGDTAG